MRRRLPAGCLDERALTRALSVGADPAVEAHLQACARCATEWAEQEALRALAREVGPRTPTPDHREQQRTELLAAAAAASPGRPRRRGRRLALAGALTAVAASAVGAAILAFWPPPSEVPTRSAGGTASGGAAGFDPGRRAAVYPHGAASFVHAGAQPDEVVRLDDGTITIEVAPLAHDERFRVITGDAEIDVRGTVFDVTASRDHLMGVRVLRGRVEVRHDAAPMVGLAAGERWEAPAAELTERPDDTVHLPVPGPRPLTSDRRAIPDRGQPSRAQSGGDEPRAHLRVQPESDEPRVQPPRGQTGRDEPRTRPSRVQIGNDDLGAPRRSPAGIAFDDGWAALRAGDAATAAVAFARAIASEPGGPLAEDAAFWRAVALARAQRADDAARALARFVEQYPRSPRAGEASAMLGWLLLAEGDVASAAPRFEAAVHDRSSKVRASARKGLDEVRRMRGVR